MQDLLKCGPSRTGACLLHNHAYKNFVAKWKRAELKLLLANRYVIRCLIVHATLC